jgi:hypothetical protein
MYSLESFLDVVVRAIKIVAKEYEVEIDIEDPDVLD